MASSDQGLEPMVDIADFIRSLLLEHRYSDILGLIDATEDLDPQFPGLPKAWIERSRTGGRPEIKRNVAELASNWLSVKDHLGPDATKGYAANGHILHIYELDSMDRWLAEGAPGVSIKAVEMFRWQHPEREVQA